MDGRPNSHPSAVAPRGSQSRSGLECGSPLPLLDSRTRAPKAPGAQISAGVGPSYSAIRKRFCCFVVLLCVSVQGMISAAEPPVSVDAGLPRLSTAQQVLDLGLEI